MPPWHTYAPLYRCAWIDEGEKKKGYAGSLQHAMKTMRAQLVAGRAAWIEEVPPLDDDVPF
tara:strand:+ start:43 stop:225 length:183 start_codon:yes stop_codon:yes gene_type:complete